MTKLHKSWVPKIICSTCRIQLSHWKKGIIKSMPFGTPTLWRELQNHMNDCYFCLCHGGKVINTFNTKNKNTIKYANVQSVTRPTLHTLNNPIPVPKNEPSH